MGRGSLAPRPTSLTVQFALHGIILASGRDLSAEAAVSGSARKAVYDAAALKSMLQASDSRIKRLAGEVQGEERGHPSLR